MTAKVAPPPNVAVVDLAGGAFLAPLADRAAQSRPTGPCGPPSSSPRPARPIANAAAASQAVRPYLAGEMRMPGGARLDDAVIVSGTAADPSLDLWTRNLIEPALKTELTNALADTVRRTRLEASGLSAERHRRDRRLPAAGGAVLAEERGGPRFRR